MFRKFKSIDTLSLLFIFPAFLMYTVFIVFPVIKSIPFSFVAWNGISSKMNYVGLSNYFEMFTDKRFFNALKNTFAITILMVIGANVLALFLAVLIDHVKNKKASNLFKAVFFIPVLISSIVIGFIWSIMFNYNFGVINNIFEILGLSKLHYDWLGDPNLVMYSLIFTLIWQYTGYYLLIYLAALQSIPLELIESSKIDGANNILIFRYVSFPLLIGAMTINLTLSFIHGMKIFDLIVVLTNGGPGFATETMTYLIYKVAFANMRQGYGTAVALILFVVILIFTILYNKVLRNREVQL